jgi:ribosomal-protein-alanine N-acetyltransferase
MARENGSIKIMKVEMPMQTEDLFSNLPQLETPRTILRKITQQDEDDMFTYGSDEEVSRFTSWYRHNSLEDTRTFIDKVLENYDAGKAAPWGIEDKASGKLIGTCGFVMWNIRHSRAEIGYVLSRDFWNQGYMTEAVRKVIEFSFTHMGLVRLEARCMLDNIGSAKVMEKSGMQFEGILRKQFFAKGNHHDVKMYSMIR